MSKNLITNVSSQMVNITKEILNSNIDKKLILVRSVENIGSLSGCLNGWIDAKISEYGRKQAKYLSINYFANFDNKKTFGKFYTSDLIRAKETADICTGYDFNVNFNTLPELREIYFGDSEGLFYDGLPKEEKSIINKPIHKFKNGEAWLDIKFRCIKFLDQIDNNKSKPDLVFTHGGFLTSMLYSKGIKALPPNGSVIIISLNEVDKFMSDYSYKCDDKDYNEEIYKKYNPLIEQYLNKRIKQVDAIYHLHDISEELI
jgi:broad specificity phosphatase PhoE